MASTEKLKQLKEFVEANDYPDFVIPDNCPGDGWEGGFYPEGLYWGSSNAPSEFLKYEDIPDEMIDIILEEAQLC